MDHSELSPVDDLVALHIELACGGHDRIEIEALGGAMFQRLSFSITAILDRAFTILKKMIPATVVGHASQVPEASTHGLF